jgi:FkbH-like protein
MMTPHDRPPLPWRLTLIQFGLSIPILLTLPVVAAAITGWMVSPLRLVGVGHLFWQIMFWASAAPLIYTIWLLVFLGLCAADVQSRRWYRGLKKVPRVTTAEGITKFFPVITLYMRMRFVYSLPLVEAFLLVPGLRWLVLWSYSTSVHLAPESYILGVIFDPDLTEIGQGAVIGTSASIVSHSVTAQPDGTMVLVTAPIVIGARAVVGGGSLVALGTTIGADSFVEPMSSVAAFTQIPPGEVWGGNPAVFRRKRFEVKTAGQGSNTVPIPANTDLERMVCRAVASALRQAESAVPPTFSSEDCPEWDSLGQMAVASTLFSLTGTEIPLEQCFRLRSVPQIVDYLAARQTPPARQEIVVLPTDPELLPLLNHKLATQQLANREASSPGKFILPTIRVIVASTFSVEPLSSSLKLWCHAFGIPVEWESAGFDQVQQALLDPDSSFRRNVGGINVILTRVEDLLDGGEGRGETLLSAIGRFAQEYPQLLVVANLPLVVSQQRDFDGEQATRLRERWSQSLSEMKGVQCLDFAGIVERVGTLAAANPEGERIAAVPYSADVYAELGIAIARQVRCRRVAPKKVLALDADGILWGRVLGEEGIEGIELGSERADCPYQRFQRVVQRLKARGVLLAIVSRNELSDVQQVFDIHPGMVLRSGDIAAWRVNWHSKSQNLREIASELNLGLDSFVFVDDDPANQLEVQTALPKVTVVPLPQDPARFAETLERLWCFDAPSATEADAQRTQMIQQEHARQSMRNETIDLETYLASLNLRGAMRLATAADMPRVAQLTQKTNQFNLSLKRRSEAELGGLSAEHSIFVIEVQDRFGDYGLVGVCILRRPSGGTESVEIDTLLISCRALGRGVEDATLFGILELVKSWGGRQLDAELVVGSRNQPVVDFLTRRGFAQMDTGRFSLAADATVTRPGHIQWVGPLEP